MNLTLGVVTSAALLDSVNPCAISVLILTVAFLLSLKKSNAEILKIGLTYILALYLTYLFIGLGVLRALSFFGFPNFIARIGATILALTGLINLAGYFIPNFPIKLKISNKAHGTLAKYMARASYSSVFVLGILVGLYEFPCTGGPYLSILSLVNHTQTFTTGFLYLLYYNFVFVLPLIIILLLSSWSLTVEKLEYWKKKYTKKVDIITSILMIILAVVIFVSI